MISAADVEVTLRYIVPGFLALKVFYFLGLKTRRTDLEWTLWSLLAAVLIDAGVGRLNPPDANVRLLIAVVTALLAGLALAGVWYVLCRVWPSARWIGSRTSWDAILPTAKWIQIWTQKDQIIIGYPRVIADSVDTDQLDLYVQEPAWVDPATGARSPMQGVAGVLIAQAEIRLIQVLDEGAPESRAVTAASVSGQNEG